MHDLILVVDDDRDARDGLRIRLTGSGFKTIACGTGEEALRLFDELRPRLVLLDASLPGLSGPEVCERIRQQDPEHHTRIIFVSGATSPSSDYVERCAFMNGADHFVRKPFDIQEIMNLGDELFSQVSDVRCKAAAESSRSSG